MDQDPVEEAGEPPPTNVILSNRSREIIRLFELMHQERVKQSRSSKPAGHAAGPGEIKSAPKPLGSARTFWEKWSKARGS